MGDRNYRRRGYFDRLLRSRIAAKQNADTTLLKEERIGDAVVVEIGGELLAMRRLDVQRVLIDRRRGEISFPALPTCLNRFVTSHNVQRFG